MKKEQNNFMKMCMIPKFIRVYICKENFFIFNERLDIWQIGPQREYILWCGIEEQKFNFSS